MFAVTLEPLSGGAACGHRRLSHQIRRREGFDAASSRSGRCGGSPMLVGITQRPSDGARCLLLLLLAAQKWVDAAILSS